MYTYLPKIRLDLTERQGIIKVLGILWINGESEDITEVLATTNLLLGDASINMFGSLLNSLGIGIGQSVFSQNSVHLGIILASTSQDIDNLTNGILAILRPFRNLYNGLVTCLAIFQETFGYEDIVGQGTVLSEQVGKVLLDLKRTYETLVRTLHNLHNLSLTHMMLATSHHRGFHAISVHGVHTVSLSHQDRFATLIRLESILSVSLTMEDTLHDLGSSYIHTVAVARFLDDKVIHHHFLQNVHAEHLGGMSIELQYTGNILEIQCFSRI